MKHLDGILKLVDTEFGAIEENGKFRSRDEIDSVYKLIDIAKDIYCIWHYESEMDDGYSENYSYGNYPVRHNVVYDDGMSYARGRGRSAKRDSLGRYSRDRGYSMDDGKQGYVEELRELMHNAPDENTRQGIQRMINQMEQG